MIGVLVPTLTGREPRGLEHIPGWASCTMSRLKGWARAMNVLLDQSKNDVLLMDDDVTLTPHTFTLFEAIRPHADIIGFTLVTPNNKVQSAGWAFQVIGPMDVLDGGDGLTTDRAHHALVWPQYIEEIEQPAYVAHVSASCMFIKRRVIESGLRFPEWPGLLYEDVRFTVEAWLKGFRVAYCPGVVFHEHSATKRRAARNDERVQQNYDLLVKWLQEIEIGKRLKRIAYTEDDEPYLNLKDGEVPIGRQPIPQVPIPQDTEARRPA